MIRSGKFSFRKLELDGIDNSSVLSINVPAMADEENCLFHVNVPTGNDYFTMLHTALEKGIKERKALPVARFADGEYAFYHYSLKCNGLYQQAESIGAVKKAMPSHIEALRFLAQYGKIASLIFPGNSAEDKSILSLLGIKKQASALTFIEFLYDNGIELTGENYVPFYVVYAYLTSARFAELVHGKNIAIVNSDCNIKSCVNWFARLSSAPKIHFVEIPDSYVATRWSAIREKILRQVPPETEICLSGAGVGALLVCVDVARELSIPAIDAGHVLNMMNGRVDKSKGPRLYTLWKGQRLSG